MAWPPLRSDGDVDRANRNSTAGRGDARGRRSIRRRLPCPGDVKLAALLGVGLGVAVVPAFVIGMTAAAVFSIALLLRHGTKARKETIAYGPFLAFGALVALFVF